MRKEIVIMKYECPYCRRAYANVNPEPQEDITCPNCRGMWLTPLLEERQEQADEAAGVSRRGAGFSALMFWPRKTAPAA